MTLNRKELFTLVQIQIQTGKSKTLNIEKVKQNV